MILNPVAGKGSKTLPKGLSAMAKEYEIYITKEQGDCERFIRAVGETGESAKIWVWGGDGTVHEAVNGAFGYPNLAIGVFPVGTGNDYVKNFGNLSVFLDMNAQLAGTEICVDVMQVNDRVCVNMLNIGLDCQVATMAADMKKLPLVSGFGAYVLSLLVCFFRAKGESLTFIHEDGRKIKGAFLLSTVGKGSFYGGGFQAAPYAKLDDGFMDFGTVGVFSKLELMKLIPSYQKGTYLHKHQNEKRIQHQKIKKITIEGNTYASFDGETIPFTKLDIKVVEKGLTFILPKGATILEKPKPEEALQS